jgi:CMP-N-acetylneuraminic acid synthetase
MFRDPNELHRVAVVLARGGSNRLPKKNLLELSGKSISVIATEVGVVAGLSTYISSDSLEILGLEYSAEVVKSLRPNEFAQDDSSSEEAVLELAGKYNWSDETEVVLLPPTSPLRTAAHLETFLRIWDSEYVPKGYEQAISVVRSNQDFWGMKDNDSYRIRNVLLGKIASRRSQERESFFMETSAINLSKLSKLRSGAGFTDGKLALIELPKISAIDIDDLEDFEIAKKLFE